MVGLVEEYFESIVLVKCLGRVIDCMNFHRVDGQMAFNLDDATERIQEQEASKSKVPC